jgi:hypothetical protein
MGQLCIPTELHSTQGQGTERGDNPYTWDVSEPYKKLHILCI